MASTEAEEAGAVDGVPGRHGGRAAFWQERVEEATSESRSSEQHLFSQRAEGVAEAMERSKRPGAQLR